MKSRKGFTLIELMIVVLIVAVLAAVLVPMMRARLDAAKWSEARSAIGNLASGVRAYWAEHQDQAGTADWVDPIIADVCITRSGGATVGDLDGKYFTEECYLSGDGLAITSVDEEHIAFTVTCTAGASTRTNVPTNLVSMTLTVRADGTSAWSEEKPGS